MPQDLWDEFIDEAERGRVIDREDGSPIVLYLIGQADLLRVFFQWLEDKDVFR